MNATLLSEDALSSAPAEGFKQAQGLWYNRFFRHMHRKMEFDWYFEIGTRNGKSLRHCRSKAIAVDPAFRVEDDIIKHKQQLHLFQLTSDDFFAAGFLQKLGIRPTVSFLDGMHRFEFLLRDFMNTEDAATPGSIVMMHDCCPFDHEMTRRDPEVGPKLREWTGDVWKLIPILREYRPELKLTVLDAAPTGVVLVEGLNPGDRKLRVAYDEIIERYMDMSLSDFGLEKFYSLFEFTEAESVAGADFPMFRPLAVGKDA